MRNKLFTASVDKMLFKQYPLGSNLEKQKVVAKIFNPYGDARWYLLNSDPEDPDYIWAIVSMHGNVEIGSVSRSELLGVRVRPFGLPLERDLYFTPQNAAEVYRGLLDGKFYEKGGYMAEGGEIVKERNGKLYREEWAGSNRWLEVDSQFKMTKDEHEAKAFQENLNGNYESRDNHKHIAATLSGEPIQLQEHHNRYMAKGGKFDDVPKFTKRDEIAILQAVYLSRMDGLTGQLEYFQKGASRYFHETVRGNIHEEISKIQDKINEVKTDMAFLREETYPIDIVSGQYQAHRFLDDLNDLVKTNAGRNLFETGIEKLDREHYSTYLKVHDILDNYVQEKYGNYMANGGEMKNESEKTDFYAITKWHTGEVKLVPITNVSFWQGRQNDHEPTKENLELFFKQIPWDETVCIYDNDTASDGTLHSAHTPLFTAGAKYVHGIVDKKQNPVHFAYKGFFAKGGLTNLQGTAPVKKYDFDNPDINVVQ